MEYTIYLITTPTGAAYVGRTGMRLKRRWSAHISRALREKHQGVLYASIREFGPEAFVVEPLCVVEGKDAADDAETKEIQRLKTEWPGAVLNISDGGKTDGSFGGPVFWERIRKNPEALEAYLKKLSEAQKARGPACYGYLVEAAARWRRENPRQAYKNARRALRCGAPGSLKPKDTVGPVHVSKKAAKIRCSRRLREQTTHQWQKVSDQERRSICEKIAKSLRIYHQDESVRARTAEQLSAARNAIDRKVQGPAASKGLKSFWTELKKDPEAYAEYMARRTATLMKTIESKQCKKEHTT